MKKTITMSLALVLLLALMVGAVSAYDENGGTIRGAIYQDVNGDGICVNTGVAGEEPVPGVSIEFVSDDGEHTIHLYTGDDGTYGLAEAGFSNWRLTAVAPSSDWVITSQNPRYAYIHPDQTEATDMNFCVAKAGYWTGPVYPINPIYPGGQVAPAMVMPESGAPAPTGPNIGLITAVMALGGFSFILLGLGVEVKRRHI